MVEISRAVEAITADLRQTVRCMFVKHDSKLAHARL